MRKSWSAIAAATALGAGLLIAPATTSSALVLTPVDPDRQCAWPINYPGTANYAFPDTDAAYFIQAAILDPGDQIVITGKDPKARYWSLQTYRFSDSTVIDSVNDTTVKRRGKGKKRRWTVTVTSPDRDNGKNPNVLSGAGAFDGVNFGSNITVVMYRVYVSGTRSESGGSMPKVALKTRDANGKKSTIKLTECRGDQIGLPENRPSLEPGEGADMLFRRGPDARFYPSADTSYLVAQAEHRSDEILVMTGRAPRTPKDVRYWSICQNVNAGDLPVVDCLRDDLIALNDNRTYTVAIVTGEQRDALQGTSTQDVSYLDWGSKVEGEYEDAFLIYRNILSRNRFTGSASRVPVLEPAEPIIGDYAPQLQRLSVEQFIAEYAAPS